MAWDTQMIIMLRVLVSDLDDTPTYSDTRLEQLLVVAAHYVNQEIDFDRTYTIDIVAPSITPDPTTITDANSHAFINFVVLKAACLADMSTFRTKAAAAGIKARCGPAQLETLQHLQGFRDLLDKGPCAAYTTLKKEYEFGDAVGVRAILSPFISNDFDPDSLSPGRHSSSRQREGFF